MTSVEIQTLILKSLRHDAKGLDHFQIAADTGQAPFRVRAELRVLRRGRLVRDYLGFGRVMWCLTGRGWDQVHGADQLELA